MPDGSAAPTLRPDVADKHCEFASLMVARNEIVAAGRVGGGATIAKGDTWQSNDLLGFPAFVIQDAVVHVAAFEAAEFTV